ncbi:MAG: lytic transglycosylase domain-containing protein [Gaiellaceae bacterium]
MRRLLALALVAAGIGGVFLYLQHGRPDWLEPRLHPLLYEQIVTGHARHYGIDPALLAAVIEEESRFQSSARSSAGAIGLMQLMPSTAQGIALRTGGARFRVDDLYDPEINVRYGSWYLRHLLQRYGDERLALAAYNAGQRNVDRWRAAHSGIAFAETRAYVDRVEELKQIYRHAYPQLASGRGTALARSSR